MVKKSKQVYEALLEELTTWRLQPGDILVEEELAQKLGTSRTPVREALRMLVAEGFLRVMPRSGYLVLPLTPKDVREIYHIRLLLEGEAAALAAEKITEQDVQQIIQELETHLKEFDLQRMKAAEAPKVTFEQNTHFHLAIARASGSTRLADLIEKILQDFKRVTSYYESPHDQAFVAQVHLDILTAIRSGDPERARLAMRQHIETGQSTAIQHLVSKDSA